MALEEQAKSIRVAVHVSLEQLGVAREIIVAQPRPPHVSGLTRAGQRMPASCLVVFRWSSPPPPGRAVRQPQPVVLVTALADPRRTRRRRRLPYAAHASGERTGLSRTR